jgi:hypothetical protein
MALVQNWNDVEKNIEQLLAYLRSANAKEREFALDLVRRGTCFIVKRS